MAQVIPDFYFPGEGGRDYGKLAEQRVYNSLKEGLDNNVLVLHSQDYQTRNQYFECVDGEIDFLIIDPDAGIIVLEVKSGTVERRTDGNWYQNGHRMSLSPFEQVKKNFYFLRDLLKERYPRETIGFPVGYAVCFPDVASKPDLLLSEVDEGIIICGRELPHIQIVLQNIFSSFGNANFSENVTNTLLRIRDSLSSGILYESSLPMLLEQEERVRFRLTENQTRILEFIENRPLALIKGNPGTGKSILAMRKAKSLVNQGKRVLLICYNSLLAKQFEIEASNSGYVENLTVQTFHTLAWEYVKEVTGKELTYTQNDHFWQNELPVMFREALDEVPLIFDAIIVDEAQDFRDSYWRGLAGTIREAVDFYLFYDPNQNIWNTKLTFPFQEVPYELKGNCRNTVNICKAVKKWTGIELKCLDAAPIGCDVEEIECNSRADVIDALECIFDELIENRELKPTDLIVIGAHSLKNTSLEKPGPISIGKWEIKEGKEVSKAQIPYYTYMQFKGCESPVVVLLDVNREDERWKEPKALLTAMTRAKSILYMLCLSI
jgi:hypothetical protein